MLAEGDPNFTYSLPDNEWDALALNYTSWHHRAAQGVLSIPIVVLGPMRSTTSSPGKCRIIRSTFGRCHYFTVTAGVFPGPSLCSLELMCFCVRASQRDLQRLR